MLTPNGFTRPSRSQKPRRHQQRAMLEPLEPRQLLDAGALAGESLIGHWTFDDDALSPAPAEASSHDETNCTPSGDLDGNGRLDGGDYLSWRDNFGRQVVGGEDGDGNCDGLVDFQDYVVWRDAFGTPIEVDGGQQALTSHLVAEDSSGATQQGQVYGAVPASGKAATT